MSEEECIVIECNSCSKEDSDSTVANNETLVVAVSALLVAVSVYGIYKATPYIRRWWNDKAVPNLRKMKNKVTGKAEKMNEKIYRYRNSSDVKKINKF